MNKDNLGMIVSYFICQMRYSGTIYQNLALFSYHFDTIFLMF